jgi:hypothetical protein
MWKIRGEADSRAEPRDTGAAVMSSRLKMLSGLERSDKNKRKAPVVIDRGFGQERADFIRTN